MPIPSSSGVWLIFVAGTHDQLVVPNYPHGFAYHHQAAAELLSMAMRGELEAGLEYDIRFFALGHEGAK